MLTPHTGGGACVCSEQGTKSLPVSEISSVGEEEPDSTWPQVTDKQKSRAKLPLCLPPTQLLPSPPHVNKLAKWTILPLCLGDNNKLRTLVTGRFTSLLQPPLRSHSTVFSSSSPTVWTFIFRAEIHLDLMTACHVREREASTNVFPGLCHETPPPRCSAVASLSEPNSHLQGCKTQCAGLGSLISLLGLLSFGVSLHIEYFTPWAGWCFMNSLAIPCGDRTKSIYSCYSNISHFHFLT